MKQTTGEVQGREKKLCVCVWFNVKFTNLVVSAIILYFYIA